MQITRRDHAIGVGVHVDQALEGLAGSPRVSAVVANEAEHEQILCVAPAWLCDDLFEDAAARVPIRFYTINNAHILRQEKWSGSLEPGKFADFTILEGDPFTVDPEELKDIPVWGTALSGKVFKATK